MYFVLVEFYELNLLPIRFWWPQSLMTWKPANPFTMIQWNPILYVRLKPRHHLFYFILNLCTRGARNYAKIIILFLSITT